MAAEHELAIFIAESTSTEDVDDARPAGALTPVDLETLEELKGVGWLSTVADLAASVGVEASTATNRLVNLERKGYVYRFRRGRSIGDLFSDPRAPMGFVVDEPARPLRDALLERGIPTDPYDRSPLRLEGEAAERAAEILRRRGKAH